MALKKQGVRQTIVCGDSDAENIEGIPVHKYDRITPFEMLNSGKAAFKKIKELQDKGLEFDLIHYHQPIFFQLHKFKKALGNKPIIQTTHGSPADVLANIDWLDFTRAKESLYYYFFTLFSAKRADAFVCVSPGVREDVVERFKLDPKKVFSITPGINPKDFYFKKTRKVFDTLTVSRFSPGKRYDDLIHALGLLKEKGIQATAAFIGSYGYESLELDKLTGLIKGLGLAENIKILPQVNQRILGEFYRKSKVFVLPSISESAPKVTLEAMASGMPCIVTDIIGNKGITLNGKTGFIVPKKSPEAIAEKLELLLSNNALRNRMSLFAANRARKEFSWQAIARQYKQLYSSLV
jgi:glycosyltransferase involved in cell wall biosynthesis